MEMQNFIKNFAAQFEETDIDVFTSGTKFREIEEWSSLIALSVMAMIDEEYDITISGNEMRQSQSVEDLFNLIQSKK